MLTLFKSVQKLLPMLKPDSSVGKGKLKTGSKSLINVSVTLILSNNFLIETWNYLFVGSSLYSIHAISNS